MATRTLAVTTRRRKNVAVLAATAVAAAGGSAAAAPAADAAPTVKLAGGNTALALDRGVAATLRGAGVHVSTVGRAKAGPKGIAFPITGGRIDPATARGQINHAGGLSFRAGDRRVVVRSFRVRIGRRGAALSARTGNARIPLLSLNLRNARLTRPGFATRVSGVRANLTRTAAHALNRAFHVHLFRGGMAIGKLTVHARPAQLALTGRATALALDPATAEVLKNLGVSATPLAPATVRQDGINFPISGGLLDARSFAGQVFHRGGIRLSAGSKALDLRRFTIRIDRQPDLTAAVGNSRVSILNLDLRNLTTRTSGRNVTLAGVKASLTAQAAAALNATFGVTAFKAGILFGTATVKARVR